MAAKILILCALVGVVTARCDHNGTKSGLAKCVDIEINVVADERRDLIAWYTNRLNILKQHYSMKFRNQLLESINQTENILESENSDIEWMKNGSILIEAVSKGARKCFAEAYFGFDMYTRFYLESLDDFNLELETVQNDMDNAATEECQKKFDDIADRVEKDLKHLHEGKTVPIPSESRYYDHCLTKNSVKSMIMSVKQLVKEAERILATVASAPGIDDVKKSKIETLSVELGENVLNFDQEILNLDGGEF